jgi:hypothetical protein
MHAPISARTLLALAAIFALALGLRALWLARTDTEPAGLLDSQYYHVTAQNIAEGRGYSVGFDERGFVAGDTSEATAFWAPGYPFALAPLYKLFGPDIRVAKAFNAIVGALTVVPIFFLARHLGNASRRSDGSALLAAGLFAVAPSLVFWTPTLFSETFFVFGVASTLAVASWAGDRGGTAAFFIAGLTLAATAFVRSQGVLLIVPVAVLLLRDFEAWRVLRTGVPVAAGIALLIVPWALRNEAAMGRPYLINDNLGYNLRIAHAPYSTGTSVPPQDLWDERPGISFKEREIFFDDEGRRRALTYAREHPGRELELAARRIGYLLRSDAAAAVSAGLHVKPVVGRERMYVIVGDVFYYSLIALAAISLLALRRSRVWLALWSATFVWIALHLVFAGEPRYHLPLMPVLAILAAGTVHQIVLQVTLRERRAALQAA